MEERWWTVRTGFSNDEHSSDSNLLGTFFGYVDDIALRLADKQCGFWCAGALYFSLTKWPTFPKDEVASEVNVVIRGINWDDRADLMKKMEEKFQDRPVEVLNCNLYGTVTIRRKTVI